MSICTFCGHSSVPEEIRPRLAAEIERHITELGVTEFWVGNYGGFDRMAKSEVQKAKLLHPEVKLCLLVPYLPAENRRISCEGVDEVLFPAELETVPKRLAIPRLNRYMLQRADYLIACVSHVSSGAYQTLEEARRRELSGRLKIVNLQDFTFHRPAPPGRR